MCTNKITRYTVPLFWSSSLMIFMRRKYVAHIQDSLTPNWGTVYFIVQNGFNVTFYCYSILSILLHTLLLFYCYSTAHSTAILLHTLLILLHTLLLFYCTLYCYSTAHSTAILLHTLLLFYCTLYCYSTAHSTAILLHTLLLFYFTLYCYSSTLYCSTAHKRLI